MSQGRLDVMAKRIFDQLADQACSEAPGPRAALQPVIDRYVEDNFPSEEFDVSLEGLAERFGLLKPRRQVR